jgi:SAM-dependent methyltransferase
MNSTPTRSDQTASLGVVTTPELCEGSPATQGPGPHVAAALNSRKFKVWENAEREAENRRHWRKKAAFFHLEDNSYLRFLIPAGLRVLEIGCGTGDTLAALQPSFGVGIDFSAQMISEAKRAHPELHLRVGDVEDIDFINSLPGPFDVIVIVDTLGVIEDIQALLEKLHPLCAGHTRLVIAYYSHVWEPLLRMAEVLGWRMRQPTANVISPADMRALAELAGFDVVKSEQRLLSPFRLLGIGRIINRFLSPLPIIRHFCLRHYLVARSTRMIGADFRSASIVIPARNEAGNVEDAVRRIPAFCDDIEIIFVEGHSRDGTLAEIRRVKSAYSGKDIKVLVQEGEGKADAVFLGFDQARGEVLMILDADLTMPPEQLPKFWNAMQTGKAEFVNGSRLVYPMDDQAMRFLNLIANKAFSLMFTWLLNQRFTDTLCGTKVLRKDDYKRLKAQSGYFGNFDPFGDFALIFGASKLNLKVVEIPIRYAERVYGETQIARFRHGLMLLKMVIFAFLKIKAI